MLSPIAVGAIKTRTGDLYLAFQLIAVLLSIGGLVLLLTIPARLLADKRRGQGAVGAA
ncbi:hypothetical protein [Cupriavidus sp. RAF12]